ncbi:nuclear transcription factor Y subunit B-7-like [Apium graveolens]|uniref:nuclear transcription factor Y subunit B-7-like n=1 Tax=Apium graveolens TaxID=4045 RepID=UPI003D7918DD
MEFHQINNEREIIEDLNGPSGIASPESPCSKNYCNNTTNNCNCNCNNNTNASNTTNKEQDRFLPIANVGRIMKKGIPANGKISKDAKETVQECVSEFISFVTGEASDKCQREKRKTINGDDIIWAITILGFEDYVTPLKHYLAKYRELEGEKLNVPKHQRGEQQRLQQHDHKTPMPYTSNVYSPQNLISHPSFLPNDQTFPLPFPQNSIQSQFKQESIDSLGHW